MMPLKKGLVFMRYGNMYKVNAVRLVDCRVEPLAYPRVYSYLSHATVMEGAQHPLALIRNGKEAA